MNIRLKRLLQQHTAARGDNEKRQVLHGIHYAEGYATATDGLNLVALIQDYPQSYEGKTLNRQGGEIPGGYPRLEKIFSYEADAVITLAQLQSGLKAMQQDEEERRLRYAREERIDEYTPAWRVLRIEDGGGEELMCVAEPTLTKFVAAMKAIKADCAIISRTNMRAGTLLGKAACTYAVPGEAEITTITI